MDTPSARDGDEQELLPCPFCDGKAEFGVADDGINDGGEFIQCTELRCGVSSRLFFPSKMDVKPLLVEVWNRRPVHRDAEGVLCRVKTAFPNPQGTEHSADAIAFHLERGHDNGDISRESLASWLRDLAMQLRAYRAALSAAPGVCSHLENYLHLEKQIEGLAAFILDKIPGEPSQSEGAVECAIRIIRTLQAELAEATKGVVSVDRTIRVIDQMGILRQELAEAQREVVELKMKLSGG